MPKRPPKSDDPIISAKRVLDHVIAKHDPQAAGKAKAGGGKRTQKKEPAQTRRK